MPTPVGSSVQSCPNKAEEKKKQDPKLHWIKFKIQDDKGKPMGGVMLRVTLPDGTSEEMISSDDGMIEIQNIQPGNCKIESDWNDTTIEDSAYMKA